MKKLSIEDLNVKGKRIIMRVDFNVPLDDQGRITNNARIAAALPSIKYVLDKGGSLVLLSHLGRPNGEPVSERTLKPVAEELESLLKRPVKFVAKCIGPEVEAACDALRPSEIILLENVRFHIEEEGKRKVKRKGKEDLTIEAEPEKVAEFRASLSKLGDIFCLDAFGTAHRAHSSVVGIDLPQRVSGILLKIELEEFDKTLENPKRPFLAILGGAKVADKIPLMKRLLNDLLENGDQIIVCGGMAFTFKKSIDQVSIGSSLFDQESADIVADLMDSAREKGIEIHLPEDYVCGDEVKAGANTDSADDKSGIPEGWYGLDIGPKSREKFSAVIANAKTIIWNGPAGVFEYPEFEDGTRALAEAIADAATAGARTVVGGGDTATAAEKFGITEKIDHVSTGGGAALALLSGEILPGVEALTDI